MFKETRGCVPGGFKELCSTPTPSFWEDGVGYVQTPRECVLVFFKLQRVLRKSGWEELSDLQSQTEC